jgi:hypothetical protein
MLSPASPHAADHNVAVRVGGERAFNRAPAGNVCILRSHEAAPHPNAPRVRLLLRHPRDAVEKRPRVHELEHGAERGVLVEADELVYRLKLVAHAEDAQVSDAQGDHHG